MGVRREGVKFVFLYVHYNYKRGHNTDVEITRCTLFFIQTQNPEQTFPVQMIFHWAVLNTKGIFIIILLQRFSIIVVISFSIIIINIIISLIGGISIAINLSISSLVYH